MPTNDEILAMAERLDEEAEHKMQRAFGSGCGSPDCGLASNLASEAAAMLRSILAERETKIEALTAEFQTAIYSDVEGLYEK